MKKLIKIARKNLLFLLILAVLFFCGSIIIYRKFASKSTYIYAKVKLNQGSWWAAVNRPNIWFINSLKKQLAKTKDNNQEITSVTYYPWANTSQFDVFITLKLKVSPIKGTDQYSFQRSTIGVGAPIDLEFSNNQFSGTIIEISTKPIIESYLDKKITLVKKYVYPWEYEAIKIGDKYNNGMTDIFEITNKEIHDITEVPLIQQSNIVNFYIGEPRNYIVVQAKIKVKLSDKKMVFGEEQVITPGQLINLTTDNLYFGDYTVIKIE